MKTIEQQVQDASMVLFGIGAILILFSLSGCGNANGLNGATGATGAQGVPGPAASSPPTSSVTAVQTVVNGYNEYLASVGSDPIQPGLKCTLYNVPNMPADPCLTAATGVSGCSVISSSTGYTDVGSFTYTGTIDQPNEAGTSGFNLLPSALKSLYSADFEVVCTGYFVNPDYAYHEFDITSDDGSLMYINGGLVISNDGEHSIADVTAEKYLEAQVYSFQLDYFQGPGNVAFIVNMDNALLPAANLYH